MGCMHAHAAGACGDGRLQFVFIHLCTAMSSGTLPSQGVPPSSLSLDVASRTLVPVSGWAPRLPSRCSPASKRASAQRPPFWWRQTARVCCAAAWYASAGFVGQWGAVGMEHRPP